MTLVLILHISLLTFSMIILRLDYSRNFLAPAMIVSCYEDEVVVFQPLTIDIRNKIPFLTYGEFENFICSSFDQGFHLKLKK